MECSRGLAHVVELLLQLLTSEEDPTLDSPEGDAEGLGDLVVLIARDKHGERLFERRLESSDRLSNFLDIHRSLGRILSALAEEGDVIRIHVRVDDALRTDELMVVVDEDITHNL